VELGEGGAGVEPVKALRDGDGVDRAGAQRESLRDTGRSRNLGQLAA
jgi:hypothetical protein